LTSHGAIIAAVAIAVAVTAVAVAVACAAADATAVSARQPHVNIYERIQGETE